MSKRVHVMHIIDGLGVGGTETILYEVVSGLVARGFKVSVCYFQPGALVEKYSKLDISLIHVPWRFRIDPALFFRLCKTLRSAAPDVVHTHLFKSDFHGLLAARLCKTPVVLTTLHSTNEWARNILFGAVYGYILRLIDRVVVLSDEIGEYFARHSHVPQARFLTINNAIPIQKYEQDSAVGGAVRDELGVSHDAPLIGFIARLAPPKDHETFLRSAVKILQTHQNARFLIVGEGVNKARLVALSAELGLERAVIFSGFRSDIPAILSALDMVVLASQHEGLPVSLMEAMAASRPIVATAVRGITGVITNGENGILVPFADPEALAKACSLLLSDSDLRQRLIQAGRIRVKNNYSIDATVDQTAELYKTLLEQKGART